MRSSSSSFRDEGEVDEMELNLDEFGEYVLRGLYQTKRAMKMFSSRGLMQAKITRCLKALSEEAAKDHRERRASLSRRPSTQLPDAGLMHSFMKYEGMDGGTEDAS